MREVKVAFIAPGQGIESWESGLRLLDEGPKTINIYEQVYDATGVDIIEICRSTEPTNDPEVVQPAALGIGYAQAEVLKDRNIDPDYLIGLSAGEFTVAAISGALTIKEAAKMTKQRGIFQNEEAGGLGGAVTALHRRPLDIKSIMHELEGVWPANMHAPTITGFSYTHENYQELRDRLAKQGARVRDVNIPFPPHGDAVKKAQDRLAELFKRGLVKDAATNIISIRTARATKKARTIKHNLIWQTTQPTKLNKAVLFAIRNGVEDIYDLGPGDSITKILGHILVDHADIRVNPVSVLTSLQEA